MKSFFVFSLFLTLTLGAFGNEQVPGLAEILSRLVAVSQKVREAGSNRFRDQNLNRYKAEILSTLSYIDRAMIPATTDDANALGKLIAVIDDLPRLDKDLVTAINLKLVDLGGAGENRKNDYLSAVYRRINESSSKLDMTDYAQLEQRVQLMEMLPANTAQLESLYRIWEHAHPAEAPSDLSFRFQTLRFDNLRARALEKIICILSADRIEGFYQNTSSILIGTHVAKLLRINEDRRVSGLTGMTSHQYAEMSKLILKVTQFIGAERNLITSLLTLASSSDRANNEKERSELRLMRFVNSYPYTGQIFIDILEKDIEKNGGRSALHNRLMRNVTAGVQRDEQLKRDSTVKAGNVVEMAQYKNRYKQPKCILFYSF